MEKAREAMEREEEKILKGVVAEEGKDDAAGDNNGFNKYKAASNHHPSMLAYPPPPKPLYMSSLEMLEEGLTPVEPPRPKADPPPLPPGFVPPLPSKLDVALFERIWCKYFILYLGRYIVRVLKVLAIFAISVSKDF